MARCHSLRLTRSLPLAVLTSLAARCLLLFSFFLFPFAFASAQSATATLNGTVEDQNKAVVAGAKVKAINLGTGLERDTVTNDSGNFILPLLPPSTYTVRVERDGFVTIEVSNIVLNVSDDRSLLIQMKVGDVKEVVNVTGQEPLINESPAVGTVVDRQFVANIPLNGRSFQSLITLTPGIVTTRIAGFNVGQFSVNGQRTNSNYFTVDGVSANVGAVGGGSSNTTGTTPGLAGMQPGLTAQGTTQGLISVDALQEFRIQTSNYAAEFGRSPGAQIQLLTRSGTNDFHGSLYDYLRNDVFDANDWFANGAGKSKAPLRQSDFGGTFGGPVLLPRFGEGSRQPGYNGRNRTFFFLSYEGLRLRQPQFAVLQVPSLSLRQTAPAALQPFLNALPQPSGAELLSNGQPTGLAPFNYSNSDPSSIDSFNGRVDHTFSDRFTLFGTLNKLSSTVTSRSITSTSTSPTVTLSGPMNSYRAAVGATLRLTQNLINELRGSFSRVAAGSNSTLDDFGGAVVPSEALIFSSPFASPANTNVAYSFLNKTGFSIGPSAKNLQRQINLVDSVSATVGSHSLKMLESRWKDVGNHSEPSHTRTVVKR